MKKIKFSLLALIGLISISCGDSHNVRCDVLSADSFKTFISIDHGTKEGDLRESVGIHTSSEYTSDKSQFEFIYDATRNIPFKVYVDAKTGYVETVFIEMLSKAKNFEVDKKRMEEDFNIDPCHLDLFGKQPKEILEILGKADGDDIKDSSIEKDVRTLTYWSSDDLTAVTFKFYHSQSNKLSSITVNYYDAEDIS